MQLLNELFGQGDNLNSLQMALRAVAIFFIAFMLIRFTGMRVFGIKSAFDICVTIILGAVLARIVVGASPFVPTIIACIVLVIVHKIIATISVTNQRVSHFFKGIPFSLYKDGKLNDENLKRCMVSFGDIMEEVRMTMKQNTLENIDEIYMERTGKLSVVVKKNSE